MSSWYTGSRALDNVDVESDEHEHVEVPATNRSQVCGESYNLHQAVYCNIYRGFTVCYVLFPGQSGDLSHLFQYQNKCVTSLGIEM